MKKKQNKEEKKDKMPLGKVVRYNVMMLGKIAKMTPQYIVFMFIVGIVGGISNSVDAVFRYKLFNLLDEPDATFGRAAAYIFLIFAVNVLLQLFYSWYYQYYQTVTDKKLQHKMHEELFRHAQKMDLACFDDPKFYNDYVCAMEESKNRAVKVLDTTHQLISRLVTVGTIITLMTQIDIVVGLIIIAGAIIDMALDWKWDKIGIKHYEERKPFERKKGYIERVYHLADCAKEMRIGRVGESFREMYGDSVENIKKTSIKYGYKYYALSVILNISSTLLFNALPMIILLLKLDSGKILLGGFVSLMSISNQFRWDIVDIKDKLLSLPDNALYINKYVKFMEYEPKIIGGKLKAEPMRELELKNVTFSYNPVEKSDGEVHKSLDNVSLKIKRGESVAIVGYNGAGKTTLTKLLMRLYDPSEGEILYNGKNLKEYDIDSLREKIGSVFQDYKIFAATIAENVLGGECKDSDRETVTDALNKATFSDRLATLENGIDTQLTKEFYDDGVNLSGGESQKIAIARVFARPYELIIMDEPSSALDPEAEYKLNHTILEYARDKTVVFISHRLSTTRMADRILMFADGELVESGSHDELMSMNGKYAEMFNLQAEKYKSGGQID